MSVMPTSVRETPATNGTRQQTRLIATIFWEESYHNQTVNCR